MGHEALVTIVMAGTEPQVLETSDVKAEDAKQTLAKAGYDLSKSCAFTEKAYRRMHELGPTPRPAMVETKCKADPLLLKFLTGLYGSNRDLTGWKSEWLESRFAETLEAFRQGAIALGADVEIKPKRYRAPHELQFGLVNKSHHAAGTKK